MGRRSPASRLPHGARCRRLPSGPLRQKDPGSLLGSRHDRRLRRPRRPASRPRHGARRHDSSCPRALSRPLLAGAAPLFSWPVSALPLAALPGALPRPPDSGSSPGPVGASLACAYTLYLAAAVLLFAGAALVAEDCASASPTRRRNARLFAAWSPAILGMLWLGYLPWWPVLMEALRRPPPVPAERLSLPRLDRTLSFFAFAANDGEPAGAAGLLYGGLLGFGALESLRRAGCRFLALWGILGFSLVELLGHIHPHYYVTRWFLPAGIALPALASLPLARLLRARAWPRGAGIALLAILVAFDGAGLVSYYRSGRPDWRPLAAFLAREAKPNERIFAENQWTQICADFYLREKSPPQRERAACSPGRGRRAAPGVLLASGIARLAPARRRADERCLARLGGAVSLLRLCSR